MASASCEGKLPPLADCCAMWQSGNLRECCEVLVCGLAPPQMRRTDRASIADGQCLFVPPTVAHEECFEVETKESRPLSSDTNLELGVKLRFDIRPTH